MFEKKVSIGPEGGAGEPFVPSCAGIAAAQDQASAEVQAQVPAAVQSRVPVAAQAQVPTACAADSAKQPAKQFAERMTLDRIEGAVAVCELSDGTLANISVAELPDGAYEGMVLKRGERGWVPDADEERSRRARIQAKMNSLFV